ncbi:tripartite tricarboxylate transporter permease [Candidatus Woesearchaeota archaeon]|nr:tripartite tricarboxylate transporter permease [Candidatus Woesearchaeota archaeon]
MLEILAAIIAGCTLGIITGITPGLHINLVATLILGALPYTSRFLSPESTATAIIAMSITHAYVDFVQAVFLGSATEGSAYATTAGSEYLRLGLGIDAVRLTTAGCLLGTIATVIITPALITIIPAAFSAASNHIEWVLIAATAAIILWQRGKKAKLWSTITLTLSGALGIEAFSIEGLNEPLMPMLSGLFGLSLLASNLRRETKLPDQKAIEAVEPSAKETAKPVLSGMMAGAIISMFPALGPSHSATIATKAFPSKKHQYLILLGAVSSTSMLMAVITAYSIGKARNGSIAIAHEILGDISQTRLTELLAASLISAAIATYAAIIAARAMAKLVNRLNYNTLCASVAALIAATTLFISGITGLIVLFTATAIGLIPMITKTDRTSAMGCLIVPVILLYL